MNKASDNTAAVLSDPADPAEKFSASTSSKQDATPGAVSTAALYRAMWRHSAGARGQWFGASALLASSQLLKLLVPWMAAQAINTIQLNGAGDAQRALLWVAIIIGVYALAWAMHGPGRVLERNVGLRVRAAMADSLFSRLLRLPLSWHQKHHSGEVQHRVNQATHALYDFTQNQFIYVQSFINMVGPIVALLLLSQTAGTVALVGYTIVALVIIGFDVQLMRLAAQENQAERRYAAGLLDFIGNIGTVLSLRLQRATRSLVAQRLRTVFTPLRRTIVLTEFKWCAVDMFSIALTWTVVIVYAWASKRHGDALLIGTLFMVYQYGQQASGVIGSIASHYQNFTRAKANYASAEPLLQAVTAERRPVAAKVDAAWQHVTCSNIDYVYERSDGSKAGVFDATLNLDRGKRIALVGASGSGKSTLLRLLCGLYQPKRGHYDVDGVTQLGLKHLGSIATLIPQEADVFEATVRDNLTLAAPCDEHVLRQALTVSAFETVLPCLPQGLDTELSERGFNLSGGQRQRLALARGVVAARGSSLLLLDEPTSALDPVTENLVLQRMFSAFSDACVIASVHRMNLLKHFDTVVLMHAGRIVDQGTVPELTERQALFRELLGTYPEPEPEQPPLAQAV